MKPANVLVGTGGTPILSDFGIAVRPGEESLGGSPGFLSPERLSGSSPNPSDDIYGFGRILEDIVETGASDWEPLRRLSHRCMSPGETRPHHGTDLVSLVDSMPR
jgi:serine/threonine-protein kinase